MALARTLLGHLNYDKIKLPIDLVAGDRFAADATVTNIDGVDVPDGLMGLDIGPRTAEAYAAVIENAGTVFWNGPMGAFELEPFAAGTRSVEQLQQVVTAVRLTPCAGAVTSSTAML